MAIKRVLYVGARGGSLYTVDGRRLLEQRAYAGDKKGLAALRADLEQQPAYLTWLLFDIGGEEFHTERLPYVFGYNQQPILAAKLLQHFQHTRFRQAQKQQRESGGRRDNIFLLSGITDSAAVQPWLTCLLDANTLIAGIHTLPRLHAELLKLMRLKTSCTMLISGAAVNGIRQTFFVDGELKASRLTPVSRTDGRAYRQQAIDEGRSFWRYLSDTGVAPAAAKQHIVVFGDAATASGHVDNPAVDAHFADVGEYISKAGFSGIVDDDRVAAFFALLMARAGLIGGYASAADKRFYYHHRARRALLAAALAVWLYPLFTLPVQGVAGLQAYRASTAAAAMQLQLEERLTQARQNAPPAPITGAAMQTVVEFYQHLDQFDTSPLPYMRAVGSVLQAFTDVALNELHWNATTEPQDHAQANSAPPSDETSRPIYQVPRAGMSLYPVLTLTGDVDVQHGIRQAVQRIDALRQQLLDVAGVQRVEILSYPLEISADKTLSGGGYDGAPQHQKKFSLRITWEPLS